MKQASRRGLFWYWARTQFYAVVGFRLVVALTVTYYILTVVVFRWLRS